VLVVADSLTVLLVRLSLSIHPRRAQRFHFADTHMSLGLDITDLLSAEASIFYSQGFSIILRTIFPFVNRGNILASNLVSISSEGFLQLRVLTHAGSSHHK
jgi:hypothetical protein